VVKTKGRAMKYFPYSYGLLVLIFLLSSGTAFSTGSNLADEQQIKIFLPQSSVINSDEYRLGEISQLEGEDFLLLEKISQTVIGRSPLPGRKLTVTRSLILSPVYVPRKSTSNALFFQVRNPAAFSVQPSK